MSKPEIEIEAVEEREAQPEPRPTRREALRSLGRFAAVTPPTVGLMLAAASRPVHAAVCSPGAPDDLVCDSVDDVSN